MTVSIDLSSGEEARNMAHRIIRLFANHKMACHCFICRNLTDEEKSWIVMHQAAFGRGLNGSR